MTDHDLSGTVLDGRYKVISPISEGAMGSVYRGERIQLGRAVAIKVMHEALPDELSSRQRFEREAKLMAMLEHPNCVSVIDFGVHDDKPFLVMELVRGTSLQELIEKQPRLPIARTADILRQVLAGLGHAHELGIIHRDIKPANIMVSEQTGTAERVRILDFGLARLTDTSTKLTTGIVVGTPNYMAPEQCKGGDLDGRTDLYACGVMLFELLAGRKPFLADDPIAVVRKHISEPPPRLADIAPGVDFGDFEAIVACALAKKATDRFESAAAMSAGIEAAMKKSAAAVFAHAVPQPVGMPGTGPQTATPSGWNVPSSYAPPPSGDSLSIASESGAPEVTASQFLDPASQPVTPSQILDPASQPVPAYAPRVASQPMPAPIPHVSSQPVAGPADPAFASGAPMMLRDAASASVVRPTAPKQSLSRKQLAVAGGGVIAVIVVIAIVVSSRGHTAAKPVVDAGSAHVDEPTADPVPGLLTRANDLAQGGDPEAALAVLTKARKQYPDNAPLAVAAGKLYFGKLWWTDGVRSFRDAIRLDPSLKSDPDLLKTVLRGFNTTPDVDDRIAELMRDDLRDTIRPYLEETAKSHPNKQIRARAQAELRRLR